MGTISRLFPYQTLERLPAGAPAKIACFTLDLELDYGVRTGKFNIPTHDDELQDFQRSLRREGIPLSLFVVTSLLDRFPESLRIARLLGSDWHSHSHTHALERFDAEAELAESARTFQNHFGRPPLGYRAPQGLLRPEDVPRLAQAGFKFSSSIFPSYRPGKYNHLLRPLAPLLYENGVLELPLGTLPGLRYTISASYLKLLGSALSRLLFRTFGIPDILVIDSHLHDFIVDPRSYAKLSCGVRTAYAIRKHRGLDCLVALARHLRAQGYAFLTMTELFELCAQGAYR
jgi:hypothetical protein